MLGCGATSSTVAQVWASNAPAPLALRAAAAPVALRVRAARFALRVIGRTLALIFTPPASSLQMCTYPLALAKTRLQVAGMPGRSPDKRQDYGLSPKVR